MSICNFSSVDWAQLAQQWIQMKETFPPDQVPPAPPPPPIGPLGRERDLFIGIDDLGTEGGEAPMDMETKEEAMDGTDHHPPMGSQGELHFLESMLLRAMFLYVTTGLSHCICIEVLIFF